VDNTDDFHTFRVAQAPGAASFSVWRDGVLLSSGLPSGGPWAGAAFNIGDFAGATAGVAQIDYVRFTPGAYAPVAVPEPATISLLASGLIGLLAYAWRKRK
jgi:hypothetical protein